MGRSSGWSSTALRRELRRFSRRGMGGHGRSSGHEPDEVAASPSHPVPRSTAELGFCSFVLSRKWQDLEMRLFRLLLIPAIVLSALSSCSERGSDDDARPTASQTTSGTPLDTPTSDLSTATTSEAIPIRLPTATEVTTLLEGARSFREVDVRPIEGAPVASVCGTELGEMTYASSLYMTDTQSASDPESTPYFMATLGRFEDDFGSLTGLEGCTDPMDGSDEVQITVDSVEVEPSKAWVTSSYSNGALVTHTLLVSSQGSLLRMTLATPPHQADGVVDQLDRLLEELKLIAGEEIPSTSLVESATTTAIGAQSGFGIAQFEFESPDGYRYRVKTGFSSPNFVWSEPAPPGTSNVSFEFDGFLTVDNAHTDRSAPYPMSISVIPYWPSAQPCQESYPQWAIAVQDGFACPLGLFSLSADSDSDREADNDSPAIASAGQLWYRTRQPITPFDVDEALVPDLQQLLDGGPVFYLVTSSHFEGFCDNVQLASVPVAVVRASGGLFPTDGMIEPDGGCSAGVISPYVWDKW